MTLAPTIDLARAAAGDWDVAVVGAGPAGAAAALELARMKLAVLLVDKARFPRPKVCGCCLNARSLAALETLGLADRLRREGAVRQTVLALAAGRRRAALPLTHCFSFSRPALDGALVETAIAAGAAFLPGALARLEGFAADCHTLRLTVVEQTGGERGAAIRARVVLAADGLAGGLARRALGGERIRPGSRIGAGAVTDAASATDYPVGRLVMAIGRPGYVGLARLEDGRLNLAAALAPDAVRLAGGLGPAVESILAACALPPIPGLAALDWRGTPPLTRRPRAVAAERLFALGDAAGYVEPFTGEGIAWALAAARAVAPLAAGAAEGWRPELAREWTRLHGRLVRRRQAPIRLVAALARRPLLARGVVALLGAAPSLAAPVFRLLNTPDEPAPEAPVV